MAADSTVFFPDERDRAVTHEALAVVSAADVTRDAALRGAVDRLAAFARLLEQTPPVATSWQFAGRSDTAVALVESLGRLPQYDFELNVPSKAALGQGYLVAKINFFKSLSAAIDGPTAPRALREKLQAQVGRAIHAKMAEELFISILADAECARPVRVSAAEHLLRIWDDRLRSGVDDFTPLLEAAWQARVKVRPTLGTMLGAQEIYQLFQHTQDERFLDYFSRDDIHVDESSAFEEFVFGLSSEEIARLRAHASGQAEGIVSHATARSVLGIGTGAWVLEGTGPQALFASYRRRRLKARYRALMHTPGPKRTAEEYVMLAFLTASLRA